MIFFYNGYGSVENLSWIMGNEKIMGNGKKDNEQHVNNNWIINNKK